MLTIDLKLIEIILLTPQPFTTPNSNHVTLAKRLCNNKWTPAKNLLELNRNILTICLLSFDLLLYNRLI